MKGIERTNAEGLEYTQYVPTHKSDYPVFDDQADKEKLIQKTQDLYADGKLIRGATYDGMGGHCVMGVFEIVGLNHLLRKSGCSSIIQMFVTTNNEGPGGYSPYPLLNDPVSPRAYHEVMMLLKDCPVKEEENQEEK